MTNYLNDEDLRKTLARKVFGILVDKELQRAYDNNPLSKNFKEAIQRKEREILDILMGEFVVEKSKKNEATLESAGERILRRIEAMHLPVICWYELGDETLCLYFRWMKKNGKEYSTAKYVVTLIDLYEMPSEAIAIKARDYIQWYFGWDGILAGMKRPFDVSLKAYSVTQTINASKLPVSCVWSESEYTKDHILFEVVWYPMAHRNGIKEGEPSIFPKELHYEKLEEWSVDLTILKIIEEAGVYFGWDELKGESDEKE
jgi:hypothetical protein